MNRRDLFRLAVAAPLVSVGWGSRMTPVVYANGFPKSGNHALVKAIELLGITPNHENGQLSEVVHTPFEDGLPKGVTHHIHIKRDPRNILTSWLRFRDEAVTPGTLLARFRWFDFGQPAPFVECLKRYEGWLNHRGTLTVRYEDLTADSRCMKTIASHLGIPYIDGAWEQLPGNTRTWNPHHSDYRQIWTPQVESAWDAEGGNELLARWGY